MAATSATSLDSHEPVAAFTWARLDSQGRTGGSIESLTGQFVQHQLTLPSFRIDAKHQFLNSQPAWVCGEATLHPNFGTPVAYPMLASHKNLREMLFPLGNRGPGRGTEQTFSHFPHLFVFLLNPQKKIRVLISILMHIELRLKDLFHCFAGVGDG